MYVAWHRCGVIHKLKFIDPSRLQSLSCQVIAWEGSSRTRHMMCWPLKPTCSLTPDLTPWPVLAQFSLILYTKYKWCRLLQYILEKFYLTHRYLQNYKWPDLRVYYRPMDNSESVYTAACACVWALCCACVHRLLIWLLGIVFSVSSICFLVYCVHNGNKIDYSFIHFFHVTWQNTLHNKSQYISWHNRQTMKLQDVVDRYRYCNSYCLSFINAA